MSQTFPDRDTACARLPRDLDAPPLLRVATGSRLHGFAHAGSDHDAWVVVAEPRDHSPTLAAKRIFQVIERHADGTVTDVTYVGVGTFLAYAANAIPQALEALFAPAPEVDQLGPFRFTYRIDPHAMRASYRRVLRTIAADPAPDAKRRRHAFRLALNLRTALTHGWFNPTLTAEQRARVLDLCTAHDGFVPRLEEFSGMELTPSGDRGTDAG